MRMSFHEDPVNVSALSRDLREHGAVYWHTSRRNFTQVSKLIAEEGVEAIGLCSWSRSEFFNFLVRAELVDCDLAGLTERATAAISRWQAKNEPVPHLEVV